MNKVTMYSLKASDELLHSWDGSTLNPAAPSPTGVPTARIIVVSQNYLALSFSGTSSTDSTSGVKITNYSWDLGDGSSASTATVLHTYAAAGTYAVRLTVTDSTGVSNTTTRTVTVQAQSANRPPVPVLSLAANGLGLTADATGSSDPDGTLTKIVFNYGDGGASVSNASDVGGLVYTGSHTYPVAGTYTVTLTVSDNTGSSTSTSQSITVTAPAQAPVAAITNPSTTGATFTASALSSTDPQGLALTYAWDYGDGGTSTGSSANHTYTAAGPWTVTLTVTNSAGLSSTDTAQASPTFSSGAFVYGATKPSATNTGTGQEGMAKPTSSNTAVISGDYTISSGTLDGKHITGKLTVSGTCTVQNCIIDAYVDVNAGTLTMVNCEVRINRLKAASTDTWGVYTNAQGAAANLKFCEIHSTMSPMSVYVAGGVGAHNLTIDRCNIYDVMDGIDTYNKWVASGPTNVTVKGCYVHDLNLLTPEPRQSDNVTHCDGIQISGGDGVTVLGNFFYSYAGSFSNVAGRKQALSCVMLTPNTGPITGTSIDRNWFSGGEIQMNGGALDRQGAANYGSVTANRCTPDTYYPGANIGFDATAVGKWTATGNVWEDGHTPVPVIHWNY